MQSEWDDEQESNPSSTDVENYLNENVPTNGVSTFKMIVLLMISLFTLGITERATAASIPFGIFRGREYGKYIIDYQWDLI